MLQEIIVLVIVVASLARTEPQCEDLNTAACSLFMSSKPDLCQDPALAANCKRFCGLCALVCYDCQSSATTFGECNTTKTCAVGEVCMQKIRTHSDGTKDIIMSCETNATCEGLAFGFEQIVGRRSAREGIRHHRDLHFHCCSTDRCNHPTESLHTTMHTWQLFTTIPSISSSGGWSDWEAWGPCLEPNPGFHGTRERIRFCNNPSNLGACPHGHIEREAQRCGVGGIGCIPAKITNITLRGQWEMNGLVALTCAVSGYPTPQVQWLSSLEYKDTSISLFNGDPTTILIGPIEQKHIGTYTCEASNSCGRIKANYTAPTIH